MSTDQQKSIWHCLTTGVVIAPIYFYRFAISPLIGPRCRFQPSCSEYMIEAIREYGVIRGLASGFKRLGKCHPLSKSHGYDPVKKSKRDDG